MYAAAMPTGIDRDDVSAASSCYMRKIDQNRGSRPDDAICECHFSAKQSELTFDS